MLHSLSTEQSANNSAKPGSNASNKTLHLNQFSNLESTSSGQKLMLHIRKTARKSCHCFFEQLGKQNYRNSGNSQTGTRRHLKVPKIKFVHTGVVVVVMVMVMTTPLHYPEKKMKKGIQRLLY